MGARVSRAGLVLVVVVLLLVVAPLTAGAAIVLPKVITEEQRRIRRALREAASKHGVAPDIVDAIGYVESRWKMGAVNKSGADGARGGAWGPTQITERTARAHGYTGPMEALTQSAQLAGEWTARILKARPGGVPKSVEDAAAWWNGGKVSAAVLAPTHMTRRDYIPKALAALQLVKGTPA